MSSRKQRVLIALFLVAGIISTGHTDDSNAGRLILPDNLHYYFPASAVYGPEAVWINPAGLGSLDYASVQAMAEYQGGRYARSWGVALQREKMGLSYRYIDNPDGANFKEWLGATGVPLGDKLFLGASYRYFKDGPAPFDNRHLWTVGLTARTKGKFSWAAVFSNINRGKIDGVRTETEQRYSLAYRPSGDKLILAVDMFLSTKTSIRKADYTYYGQYRPIKGLFIDASIDSDRNFQIGVRANLLEYFVGARGNFDRHGHDGRSILYAGVTDQKQPSLIAPKSRRLVMSVSGRPEENPARPVFGRKRIPYAQVLTTLYRAAHDPSISDILLNLSNLRVGLAQAQELREAIGYFRNQGKSVTSFLVAPGNLSYYVASATDRILMPPVSQLRLIGLRAELTFYAATLDKLGVKIELLRIGDHKTAPEKYTQSAASDENRAQMNMILDDLYDQMVADIALGRSLSPDSVRRIIDNGPFTSDEALSSGLVDGLNYYDELKQSTFRPRAEISLRRYLSDTLFNDSWQRLPVLALIVAEGEITSNSGDISPFKAAGDVTPGLMKRAFDRALSDPDVAGTVLRVNSPGGSALAGEDIHRAASKLALKKPMVVSMVNVAASGGYYIAMPGRRLFANRGTVTGSIGIYGGKADFSGLYEKIGVGKEMYTRGRFAGMMSTTRPFSPEEREKYLDHLDAFYGHFVSLVAENRGLTEDSVDALSRGRIWTGRQALSNGLVDEIGGLKQTVDHLAERLQLADYRIRIYPEKRPLFVLPGRSLFGLIGSLFVSHTENSSQGVTALLPEEFLLTRMPYDIEFE